MVVRVDRVRWISDAEDEQHIDEVKLLIFFIVVVRLGGVSTVMWAWHGLRRSWDRSIGHHANLPCHLAR